MRAAAPSVDDGALRERLGGDEQKVNEVIHTFLTECPLKLTALKAAIDRRDADEVKAIAHSLKGAAGNLSATSLFASALMLEQLGADRRIDAFEAGWRQLSSEAALVMDSLRRFESAARPVKKSA